MRVVVALGGNALLRRGEPMTAAAQRENVRRAAEALAPVASAHDIVITHGNGPQVGLLALQSAAYTPVEPYPLDVLGAQTEGMIGYLVEQELGNLMPVGQAFATLLTQVEVDTNDPAFTHPSKPIGPIYAEAEARRLAKARGWTMAADGDHYRRVVPSPRPRRIFEVRVIEFLLDHGVIVICAGGGGIPTACRQDGSLVGVEAVIDKDRASALLAHELNADALLMLTDVNAVYTDWERPNARAIRCAPPHALRAYTFAPGSMGPKIEAAIDFTEQSGNAAAIGALEEAGAILAGTAGTMIGTAVDELAWYDSSVHATS